MANDRSGLHRRAALPPAALALCLLLAGGEAFASLGAHYAGTSRDGGRFRLYLDGGAFLGTQSSLQTTAVTVHRLANGRVVQTGQHCRYRHDPRDDRRNRIECAAGPRRLLGGAVFIRDPADAGHRGDGSAPMVCAQRCGPDVPRRLLLQAEDDNA